MRNKSDPDVINKYTLSDRSRYPLPADQRKRSRGGKVHMSLTVPPYLYERLRLEALRCRRTLTAVAIECLEAGSFSDDEELGAAR